VKRTIKFFFGLALFVLGFQAFTLFFALFVLNWEALMRDADTVSLVWVRKADYERLIAVLEEHGYSFEPLPPNTVAGDVIVYGDVRPLAQLIAEVGGGRVYVYTKRFEPSPQSFIPYLRGGPITVFSTSAALLCALLWAAALVAVAWYVASRRLLSLSTSLLIVLALPLLYLAELGYLVAVGGSAWDTLSLIAPALAPPAFLLLGFAIAKARRAWVRHAPQSIDITRHAPHDADVLQQLLRCVPPAGGALAPTVCAAQASAANLSEFKLHMRLGQVDSSYSALDTIRRGPCRISRRLRASPASKRR
jgi:hypothetical protein